MDWRTLAALGLALGGLSQAGYGVLLGGTSFLALISFGEAVGLFLVAAAVWQGRKLTDTVLVAGLVLAALMAIPWFTTVGPLDQAGSWASVANNLGSVVAAAAVLLALLAMLTPALAWHGVRLGLGLQALGSFVRLPLTTEVTAWTLAFTLAFVGFALATWAWPAPPESSAQAQPATSRAARKAP